MDGGQQLAGDPRHAAQFLVIVKPRDQSPRQFSRRQIDVGRLDEPVQPRAAPQPESLGIELLKPLVEAAQLAEHAVEAVRQVSLWGQRLGTEIARKGPADGFRLFRRRAHAALLENQFGQVGFRGGRGAELGGQGVHGVQLQEEFSEPLRELAALERRREAGHSAQAVGLPLPPVAAGGQQEHHRTEGRQPEGDEPGEDAFQLGPESDGWAVDPGDDIPFVVPTPRQGGQGGEIPAGRGIIVNGHDESPPPRRARPTGPRA